MVADVEQLACLMGLVDKPRAQSSSRRHEWVCPSRESGINEKGRGIHIIALSMFLSFQ